MLTKCSITNKKVVFALALLACALWGSAYPSIKIGYSLFHITVDDTPGMLLFAGYRFTLAGCVLLFLGLITGKKVFQLHLLDFSRLVILGCVMTTLQYIFFYIGLSHTSGVKGAILNGTTTFFSVLLAHMLLKAEHLQTRTLLGCLIGFAGVVSVNYGSGTSGFGFSLTGEGFLVIAGLMQAIGGIYGKIISQDMDSVVMTAWQLTIGGAVLIVFGHAHGGLLQGFTPASIGLLVYMGLLSAAAIAIMAALVKYNPVSMVTVFQFTIPVFGAGLSSLLLGETVLEWKYMAALICVCAGIYLVTHSNGTRTFVKASHDVNRL